MAGTEFTVRRKILTLMGAKFHIYNAEGNLLGFCKQKAFKLKEDLRIYTDESMSEELLKIGARAVIDISARYDVIDSRESQKIGSLRRRGLKSMLRDEWEVAGADDVAVGTIQEDSMLMALVRRTLGSWVPQSFELKSSDGRTFAHYRTHFNPFVHRMTVKVLPECPVHAFLVLASAVLLVAIEGRQK